MYLKKIPRLVQLLFPQLLWMRPPETGKGVYLTFDDGPNPLATTYVLNQLSIHKIKATFFLIGKNVAAHPTLAKEIIAEGHTIGNHTFSHCNGWKTPTPDYLHNLRDCQHIIEDITGFSPIYFRPPYGKITPSQIQAIRPSHKIVMMDILCGDFDVQLTGKNCTDAILRYHENGSIIVYHDSEKAFPRMKESLPEIVTFLKNTGIQALPL